MSLSCHQALRFHRLGQPATGMQAGRLQNRLCHHASVRMNYFTTVLSSCLLDCNPSTAIGCMFPPVPPSENNLAMPAYVNYSIVDFGTDLMYKCKFNHFFSHDYHFDHFNITCLNNGNWSNNHLPWLSCVTPLGKKGNSFSIHICSYTLLFRPCLSSASFTFNER